MGIVSIWTFYDLIASYGQRQKQDKTIPNTAHISLLPFFSLYRKLGTRTVRLIFPSSIFGHLTRSQQRTACIMFLICIVICGVGCRNSCFERKSQRVIDLSVVGGLLFVTLPEHDLSPNKIT